MTVDGWYRASGPRATFAFRVEHGRVVETAPYARSWLRGLTWAAAWETLHAQRFDVARLDDDERARAAGRKLAEPPPEYFRHEHDAP